MNELQIDTGNVIATYTQSTQGAITPPPAWDSGTIIKISGWHIKHIFITYSYMNLHILHMLCIQKLLFLHPNNIIIIYHQKWYIPLWDISDSPYLHYKISWSKPKQHLGFIEKAAFNQNNFMKRLELYLRQKYIFTISVNNRVNSMRLSPVCVGRL